MVQNRLVVHVGAPKCGSSSLQAALSKIGTFNASHGETFRYAAITDHGLAMDEELRPFHEWHVSGVSRSTDIDQLENLDRSQIAHLAGNLNTRLAQTSVILSCEGWMQQVDRFAELRLFSQIDTPVEIIAYVRPQPDYLNAHWWQWGAWTIATFEQWTYLTEPFLYTWTALLQKWARMDGVSTVQPRLLPADIIDDFFRRLSCEAPTHLSINRSLPAVALRFLQRHRDLRPHAHASDIDFVLERALKGRYASTPWVLPLWYVAQILDECRADNTALMDMLTDQDKARMQADPRWWTPTAYEDRVVQAPEPCAPVAEEIDAFAAELARALLEAERENAALRMRIGAQG